MEYYVYVTNECNLNCSYCSVLFNAEQAKIPKLPSYRAEELVNFVTSIQKNTNDSIADIYFFGGEPTLEYGKIISIIEAFKSINDYQVNFIMHTNGILLNKIPTDIVKNIKIMLVSLNYEKMIVDKHLTNYFGQIINNINLVRTIKKFPIIGRITVSPDTSLYTECCLMGNFFDYVYWQLDNSPNIEFKDYEKRYKTEISLLYAYWLNFLREGVFLRYVPFISAINHFLWTNKRPSGFYCGYGKSQIYIQTNGDCFACCDEVETKSHFIGDIKNGILFPSVNLNELICKDCIYIQICGGRCGRMHKDHSKSRINEFCQLNKYMFSIIEDTLPEIKNLITKYPIFQEKFKDKLIAYTEYTP